MEGASERENRYHNSPPLTASDWFPCKTKISPKTPAALENQAEGGMHELRDLGAELVELSVGQLKRINLPENIFDAVRECQKITAHGARRRQISISAS
jgi:hypothetical protein